MQDAQDIRLAALDRAITLHTSTAHGSREAADVVRTAEALTRFIEPYAAPAEADSSERYAPKGATEA